MLLDYLGALKFCKKKIHFSSTLPGVALSEIMIY